VDVTPACTHPVNGKPGLTGCFVPGERLTGNEPKHVFTIDLGAAGVPARLWQKGGSR